MDGGVQHPDSAAESTELARRAQQVRICSASHGLLKHLIAFLLTAVNSASPLNGEAAELWDKDPEEFKKKVLARHRDVDDE